jgi:periplasmic divalent cation tolerance protein
MNTILVYMTAPDADTAHRIGRAIVERRLAACVNIIPGMQSLYWWDGKIQDEHEVVLLAKTTAMSFAALKECIVDLHPYEVPCIVSVALQNGHGPFLDWIRAQVLDPGAATEKC